MAVGNAVSKLEVNSRAGAIARQADQALRLVADFKAWLDTQTDQDLIDLGFTSGDVAVLRSSYVDLGKLASVYRGEATASPAYDFRTFAKLVVGLP